MRSLQLDEPLPSVPVVLLCAEEDDLELVSFVHLARQRGLEPEVVTGIDADDQPLLDALSSNEAALFVALRSENLDQPRTLALKRLFARHAKRNQKLLALKLEPSRSPHAVRIVTKRLRAMLAPSENGRVARGHPAADQWNERTVVADHLPRPPPAVVVSSAVSPGDDPWEEHTVVADHLPRPPGDTQPSEASPIEAEPSSESLEIPARAAVPNTPESATSARRTNIGVWLALGFLLFAAWKTGFVVLPTCTLP